MNRALKGGKRAIDQYENVKMCQLCKKCRHRRRSKVIGRQSLWSRGTQNINPSPFGYSPTSPQPSPKGEGVRKRGDHWYAGFSAINNYVELWKKCKHRLRQNGQLLPDL